MIISAQEQLIHAISVCNDPYNSEETIFTYVEDVEDLISEMSVFSPITEYGKFAYKLIGCR